MPLRFADNAGNYFDLARRFWLTNLTKERFKFNFIRSPLGSIPSKERERERERGILSSIVKAKILGFYFVFQSGKISNLTSRTEIGAPESPDPPLFIHHEGDDHHGEIHVKLVPLERNRKGPISGYRVVVIDETDPTPFHEENLYDWNLAQEEGVNYWIAAELKPGD